MARIKMLTGVVEVGLFCHMAKAAYFGNQVCFSADLLHIFSDTHPDQDGSVTVKWVGGKVEQIPAASQ